MRPAIRLYKELLLAISSVEYQNAPDSIRCFSSCAVHPYCRDIALIWTMKLCAPSHFTGRPAGEYKENAFYQLYTMMSELFTEFSRY